MEERRRNTPHETPAAAALIEDLDGFFFRCRCDRNWSMEWMSGTVQELTGYTPEELIDDRVTSFGDIIHRDDRDAVWATVNEALTAHSTYSIVYRLVDPQGRARWVSEQGHGVFDVDGKPTAVHGYVTPMRDLRVLETALAKSEARSRTILDAAPVALAWLAPNGIVRSWNRAAERIFGWNAEEVVGSTLPVVPSELQDQFRGFLDRAVAGERLAQIEVPRRRKDGSRVWVRISSAPFAAEIPGLDGVMVAYEDVTLEHEAKRQLLVAQRMESLGRLTGGIAHDLNNMLAPMLGHAELLLRGLAENDPHRGAISEIEASALRARRLVRQLLAFGRKQPLEMRVVDVNELVLDFESMARRILGEDIEFMLRLAEDSGRVRADVSQLEQVLLNLVVNAREAMPGGGSLTITTAPVHPSAASCSSCRIPASGRCVRVSVADSGIGMDPETQQHIFEPFFTTKGLEHGTGLGLSTVYGIVTQHGGSVRVESALGSGSTFTVCLPAEPALEDREKDDAAPAPARSADTPLNILVLEDDSGVRTVVRRFLQWMGHASSEAKSPEEALAIARDPAQKIDVLLTDVVLPRMSGVEVYRAVLALRPEIRVVFMSGFTREHAEALTDVPNGAFLQKPFSMSALQAELQKVALR